MNKDSKIFVAGHRGLVGSAILKNLKAKGYTNFVLRTHAELDLTDQQAVHDFFAAEKPEYVFLAAAHVGGIVANSRYRADFIYENLMIQNNVIHASYLNNVKKLLFLGSTCIYPGNAPQPMPEDCLLTSPLEYTNEPYAIAKIAGIKMCESYNLQYGTNYIAVMPTNLYGPNDNFNLETSHVLPAMIRKVHLGKCLSEGDWEAVRKDLNARSVENISGGTSVTNRSIRNTSVTLSGRLACDSDFKNFVIYAENILRNKTPLSFQYKNISFSSGVLKSYSAESKNLSVTDIKLVFSVPQISEVVQNGN